MKAATSTGQNFSATAGLIDYLYLGVKLGIYPPLIFMGVGAMTDFGPLIANPKSLLLGAAAQLGIFIAFIGALAAAASRRQQAALHRHHRRRGRPHRHLRHLQAGARSCWAPIAVAAYSYMALVPVIQPPIMKLLTTKKERQIVMDQLRTVSKTEKVMLPDRRHRSFVSLLLPSAAPLIGMLMLGNLLKESGVVERLSQDRLRTS